jgi:hypothetical protein
MYPSAGGIVPYITIVLSAIVLLGILLNRRGGRTYVALAISATGMAMVLFSQFMIYSHPLYYSGAFLLFFGIWFNGSFFFIINRLTQSRLRLYLITQFKKLANDT